MTARKRVEILLFVFVVFSNVVLAGNWQRIGPVSGSILSIAADRRNPTLWYSINSTRNWYTGEIFSRLYRSTDNGESWLRTPITSAQSVAVDPSTSDVFVVVTIQPEGGSYTLWRSVDHGKSFSMQTTAGPKKIFFHPSNPRILYGVGGWSPWNLAISNDYGKTWSPITSLPYTPGKSYQYGEFIYYQLKDLLVSPFDGRTVYASGSISFKVDSHHSDQYQVLFVSRNLGKSWAVEEYESYTFHYDPAFPDRAFAVDNLHYPAAKMKHLTAEGWRFLAYQSATEIVAVPGQENRLYAQGWDQRYGPTVHLTSDDAGRTWRKIKLGPADAIGILIARQAPTGSMIGGTYGSGLYLVQADRTFRQIRNGFDESTIIDIGQGPSSSVIYVISAAGGGGFLYRSENGGKSWRDITDNFRNLAKTAGEVFVNPNDSNHLFVATENGMLVSHDTGNTWKGVSSELGLAFFHPSRINEVYFGSYSNRKIFRSKDGGDTLELLPMKLEYFSYITDLQFDRYTDRMYIATDLGLYASDDLGISAQPIGPEQHGRCGFECWIAGLVQLSRPGEFLLSSASGLSRTEDGGSTWKLITAKAPESRPILADQQGRHLYAIGMRLWESKDGGKTWTDIHATIDTNLRGPHPVSGMTDPRRNPWFVSTRLGVYKHNIDKLGQK